MDAQKEALNDLTNRFLELGNHNEESRISVLVSTIFTEGHDEVTTLFHVIKGILRPCDDSAPYHEDFKQCHSCITTLRWLNSSKLAALISEKWQRIGGQQPFGLLRLETCIMEIPSQRHDDDVLMISETASPEHHVTFSQDSFGVFELKVISGDSCASQNHYKFVHSSQVSMHKNSLGFLNLFLIKRIVGSILNEITIGMY